jgi:hypothetical protein
LTTQLDIQDAIKQRFEGTRLRRIELIRDIVDVKMYSRFDDWPPGLLMKGEEALKSDEAVLKVLEEYSYDISNLIIQRENDLAWAFFDLHYDGVIRKRSFDLESRVTMLLSMRDGKWKIVHEHLSWRPDRLPPLALRRKQQPREAEKPKNELQEIILRILSDKTEKNAQEITRAIFTSLGKEVSVEQVAENCHNLATRGLLHQRGFFFPKFKSLTES